MITTRFNPSVNGPLHMGHIYMVLVNEAFAREHDGRFIVRWDDSHMLRIQVMGEARIARILEGQRYDMEWLEFQPDEWIRQSDIIEEVRDKMHALPVFDDEKEEAPITPALISEDRVLIYPLTTMLTAEKVIMDYMQGITHLIRGIDLLSEYSLYQFYCRCLDIPMPKHIYLPRLRWSHGDMSKTMGARTIADLRHNGHTPQEVRDMIAEACLYCTSNGWSLDNIKGTPFL